MSLSNSAVKGIAWSSVSQFGRQGIQYLTTIILAALLTPSDFGLIAMALVFIGFLELFKDLGLSPAIIQREYASYDLLSTIFWINIVTGCIFTSIIYFAAPAIASFYRDEKLVMILQSLSLVFLISGFTLLQKTLLEKHLDFKTLAKIELTGILCGSVLGIGLALFGYGVWSLVIQSLVNTTVTSILIWSKGVFSPRFVFYPNELKELARYSLYLSGYNLFNYFVRNADYLIIGKFLGDRALGHYYLIYKIMLYPVQNITGIVSRVLFPIYSKLKNDLEKFRSAYIKVCKNIAIITFPLMLGIFGISEPFIKTFFNREWDSNLLITLLMILAPIGLFQSIAATTGSIFMSIGRTSWYFLWGIITGIIYVTGFYIGIQYGVVGVAVSYLISTIIFIYPVFALPFVLINLPVFKFFVEFKFILIASLIMLSVILAVKYFLISNINFVFQLVMLIITGISVYTAALWLLCKNELITILTDIKSAAA